MKKILPVLIIGILILSGFGAVTANNADDGTKNIEESKIISLDFSSPIIEEDSGCIQVTVENSYLSLNDPGKPMLPKIVKTIELPFGARNVNVEVVPKNIQESEISYEIRPALSPLMPLTDLEGSCIAKPEKDISTYSSNDMFPSSWFEYRTGCGLNANNERVAFVSIHLFPVRYTPATGKIYYVEGADVKVTYTEPKIDALLETNEYDLVIIAPSVFSKELERLVDHKIALGIETKLKTTEEIYDEYDGEGRDKPEQIKYFIKDSIEDWNVTYILLVGGLKSRIWANPRDDCNQGSEYWHVPVRYTNLFDNPKFPLTGGSSIHDPGAISDLYYADVYDSEGNFSSWDTNEDDVFAAWGKEGVENDTGIDLYPDVAIGRLACRDIFEVKTVVNKIIKYESTSSEDKPWFKKMVVISGDGFLDQEDLDIQWNVTSLQNGKYTIYAQSINGDGIAGKIDSIRVTLDKTTTSSISFNHDDHLQVDSYPARPIAEITSPSNGDILGNTDHFYEPTDREAYDNEFSGWGNVEYAAGIMHIRGKSYDPRPYGNVTDIHVWIENDDNEIVFSQWKNGTEMYFEGEWTTGEKLLNGRGGGLYYMPEEFEKEILWTSNGKFTGQQDVINALSEGCGFVFMSGHGSPNVWADHFPGVPGNRGHASVTGLQVTSLKPWPPFVELPVFPMTKLSNYGKLPVIVIGGCHNSQFNVSLIRSALDMKNKMSMWTHGAPVSECFSWRLVSLPCRGAIATIGNTGLGYGRMGKECTSDGGDAWVSAEFFKQYGTEGHDVLGDAFTQVIRNYVTSFDMGDLEAGHAKTVQQWALLGDPSLMLGGHS